MSRHVLEKICFKNRVWSLKQNPPMLPVRCVRCFQSCASPGSILYALAQSYGGTRHFHADQPPEAYCGNGLLTGRDRLVRSGKTTADGPSQWRRVYLPR